jgi:hypothetical protein
MEEPFVAVWDVETQQKIDDVHGRFRDDRIKKLSISCASVVLLRSELCMDPVSAPRALEEAKTRTYWIDGDVGNDVPAMVELLARAEVNVTYNGAGFDLLVLKQYADDAAFDAICTRSHDIFARVRDAQPGRRWPKLDTLLELNELPTKEADGLQAIRWWQEDKRELLQSYCESDTRSTAALGLLETVCVGVERRLPNAVFGIASALAARRAEAAFECE